MSTRVSNFDWATAILEREYQDWIGIDTTLGNLIRSHITEGGCVLDVGCGKSSPLGAYKTWARYVVGTDIDQQEIRSNRDFHALVASDGARLPFADGLFDLLLSKTAIEHMRAPEDFFKGVHRVLKPGGVFIWATSNLDSLPIRVSQVTPLALHRWVYQRLFGKNLQIEQFPTLYRANTEATVDRQLAAAGFRKLALHKASWPLYFAFNRLVFRLALPLHRWLDRAGVPLLQVHLIGVYQKP